MGPWLFAIMVNDLNVTGAEELWKYIDDTIMAELGPKNTPSTLQNSVDEFTRKSQANKFRLNKAIEVVPSVKLLGLTLTDNLKWNAHIMDVSKKVSSRLYFLRKKFACGGRNSRIRSLCTNNISVPCYKIPQSKFQNNSFFPTRLLTRPKNFPFQSFPISSRQKQNRIHIEVQNIFSDFI